MDKFWDIDWPIWPFSQILEKTINDDTSTIISPMVNEYLVKLSFGMSLIHKNKFPSKPLVTFSKNRQATWAEEWQEKNPGMVAASTHERKVIFWYTLFNLARELYTENNTNKQQLELQYVHIQG